MQLLKKLIKIVIKIKLLTGYSQEQIKKQF